ncbi:MAG: exonuclease SbcCD subunit D [Actinobacteria bacterium]|nr:exonuclease SbcCD subunit D [Actinomycetota bacterium]
MRLLHSGDWHVGKTIRGRSRMAEFEGALDQVVGIAVEEGVDAVLLAGDLYEHRSAAPDADALVFDALVRLHEARIPVVAIPGNHDSAPRFEAVAKLLKAVDVDMAARVLPPDRGGVVEVPARDGGARALVACVPFVPPRRFGSAVELFEATERWFQDYAEGMGRLLEAMATGFRGDAVNVVLAHLYASGAKLGGGEREVTVGMDYAVPASRFPADASYVALGHIHRPQKVPGLAAPGRYAGSLIQLDFGEKEQGKSVVLVDAEPGRPAKVREVPITAGRPLLDFEGTLDELAALAGSSDGAYLRVFVKTEGPVPGMADRVRELLPDAVDVHLSYSRDDGGDDRGPPLSSLKPREQFLAYYRATHGADPDDGLLRAFDEVATAMDEG